MRKFYLFVTMLIVQLVTFNAAFAADPPTSEYDAAMATIEDGAKYCITTEVEGVTFYVKSNGGMTAEPKEACVFTVNKTQGGAFGVGLELVGAVDGSGKAGHFSNTTLENDKAKLNPGTGVFRVDPSNNRADWERQVPFMNEDSLIAIRSCNTTFGESSWADAGRAFWSYQVLDGFPDPCYDYEPQYVWKFEVPGPEIEIYQVLSGGIYDVYGDCIGDEDGWTVNMGEEYGQCTDTETWAKFIELLDVVDEALGAADLNGITLEEAKAMKEQADSLYITVKESVIQYEIPEDGYYRIIAHNQYKHTEKDENDQDVITYVNKALAASYSKDNTGKVVYSTLDRSKAHFLWKLTQHGDSIAIQNAGMGTYISLSQTPYHRADDRYAIVLTEDESDASHVMFDYAWDGPQDVMLDGVSETKDIFNIRLASKPRTIAYPNTYEYARLTENYLHQCNHGSKEEGVSTDTGVEQETTFWRRTWDFYSIDGDGNVTPMTTDLNTSEWYLEYVPEEEAEELIEAFEPIRNHDVLVEMNNDLRAEVLESMDFAKDIIRTKMITSATQMSSPHSQNDFGNADGGGLECLIDGDWSTYWHSAWQNSPAPPHYVQLSGMENFVGDCQFYWVSRGGNPGNFAKEITLFGSDSPEGDIAEWTEIIKFTDLPQSGNVEDIRRFTMETAYPYIRVAATAQNFWHAAELQLYTLRANPNSQFVLLGEIAETLEQIYNDNVATADEDITPEMYQALLDAYNAFLEKIVTPEQLAELRNALETYQHAMAPVVEGTNPGEFANMDIVNAYNALYDEVVQYNTDGVYTADQIHKYAVMLKAMKKTVMEKANPVETDKWYRFMFPTAEMNDAYGFAKDGGDKTSLRQEDQGTMWGTFVAPAKRVVEEEYVNVEDTEPTEITHLEAFVTDDVRYGNELHFMAEDEIEDKDVSMFRFVEEGTDDLGVASVLADVKDNLLIALDLNTTYTRGKKLITDPAQFSSNASCLNNDGSALTSNCLLDGNVSTYWHTDYQQKILEIPYLQVALNEPISGLVQVEIGRRSGASNGHVVRMYAQGSTDAQNWTNIGYVETPYSGNTSEIVSSQPIDLGGTYSHLRFILTYRYGTDGGGNMEFDPFAEITGASDWNQKWSYFHCSEFQIYPLTPDTELDATAQALQDAYTTANKVVLKNATAEDVAAAAQVYRTYQTEFNAEAGKEVLPAGKDKADPTYVIQNKATGLYVSATGSGNQDYLYLRTLPSICSWKAIGYQRSLVGAKNLKGESCNNLHAGENYRRLCTWGSTEPNSNSGLLICEAEAEYEAPEAFTFFRDVKPGAINGWTSAVDLSFTSAPDQTPVPSNSVGVAYTCLGRYTIGEDEDAETFLAVKAIESIPAGEPVIYILNDTTSYDAEVDDDAEPIQFTMSANPEIVKEGKTVNGLIGLLSNLTLKPRMIYFTGNYARCIADLMDKELEDIDPTGSSGYYIGAGGVALDLDQTPNVDPDGEYDFAIYLGGEGGAADVADGIENTIEKISQPGNVYSVDGKLLRTGATLNSLKALGRGMYILNGVKVYVK